MEPRQVSLRTNLPIDPLTTVGPLMTDRAAVDLLVAPLGRSFPVYPPGPVTLRLPIAIGPGVDSIVVSVTFAACSDAVCLPPVVDRTVNVAIPPAAP